MSAVIETGSYAEFSAKLHASVNAMRVPVNGTIEVTHRCPLTCAHCYNNLPMGDAQARNRELSTDELQRVLDELAELGCLWLLFTGGEIFARPDSLEVYTYAKRKGFLVTLFTNGTLVTERIADHLAEHRPFDIEITLYGATRETYEALTGVPGSYERCLRGIRLLLERKLPLKLKTVAVSMNVHELPQMRELAESFGVEFKFDPMINPRTDCSASPLGVRLTPAEIVALDMGDAERAAEWRKLATEFAPEPPPTEGAAQLYSCGGGVNSFAIDPYGRLTICVLSHQEAYDLRGGSVREGWEKFLLGVRQKKAMRVTKCTACSLRSLCGSCPANAELEAGDPESPVDFLCRTAHLRAHVLGIDVPPHGDCEYCAGGSRRVEIDAMAAQRAALAAEPKRATRGTIALVRESNCSSGAGACSACHHSHP